MSDIGVFQQELIAISSPVIQHGQTIPRSFQHSADVKLYIKQITIVQRELRDLKKRIHTAMQHIRLQFSNKAANVSHHPILGIFSKKNAIHLSAQDKQHVHNQEHAVLAPYQNLLHTIDAYLNVLERLKLDLEQKMLQEKNL